MIFHVREAWLPFGWAAVDLFFVLSGYLITSIILREGAGPGFLGNFYVRRGLRTWPIYYLLIAIVIVLYPVLPRRFDWSQLPFALTYTQGLSRLWGGSSGPLNLYLTHTWSLAIEEQFYLIWPALVLLVGRRRVALLALVCAGGSILARRQGIWWDIVTRADGLALGGLLAALRFPESERGPRFWGRGIALGAIRLAGLSALAWLCVLGIRFGLRPEGALVRDPVLTLLLVNVLWLGLIEVVLAGAGRPALGLLRLRPLRWLGQISYGLYLYHFPLVMFAIDLAGPCGYTGRPVYLRILGVLLAVPVAALSWRFIERPLLELKRKYAYHPREDDRPAPPGHHLAGARKSHRFS
jgi:peptidoglycan/LPS O-acetylase OafA/YrhL